MYATMRHYPGIAPRVLNMWLSHQPEIAALHRHIPGFVQYDLMRTAEGVTTLTVCTDRLGAEVANMSVAAWIEVNLPALLTPAPVIMGGEDLVHISAEPRAPA
ncbi:MAG: hypothetical protein ACJ789_12775 [Thermomicrobiales bacterium]